tara:strand:+ start:934 stop:1569 length:636 start_codon:yes stop_codon:yes gene_type:complete
MCGRFTFNGQDWPEIVASIEKPSTKPDFNISPQDSTPVIYLENGHPAITSMRWGLRPSWSKKSTMEPINARIETVESKPMFREAFQTRRCIVPANGWYEWKTTPRGKVPFYHQSFDESVLSIAGIYEQWLSENGPLHTFSILTQEAMEDVKHIHNRMPVLISAEDSECWLEKKELIINSSELKIHPVGREVNKTSANGPQLIQPLRTLFDW